MTLISLSYSSDRPIHGVIGREGGDVLADGVTVGRRHQWLAAVLDLGAVVVAVGLVAWQAAALSGADGSRWAGWYWLGCLALAGCWAAALVIRRRRPAEKRWRHAARRPFNLTPYVAAVIVSGLLLAAGDNAADQAVARGTVVFFGLILVRHIAAAYEHARLLRRVDAGMQELRHHERRFRSMVKHAADIILLTDTRGRVRYASPALRLLVGMPEDDREVLTEHYIHPEDLAVVAHHQARVAAVPAGVVTFRTRIVNANGSWRWLEVVSTNLLADPSVRGIVSNARDITDTLRYQEQLAHQASHDELTDLPNRSLLLERTRRCLPADSDRRAGVALVDLDDFKAINDRLGHDVGDALLITRSAALLARCVGPRDTVARLGGDEFAVLLADASPPRTPTPRSTGSWSALRDARRRGRLRPAGAGQHRPGQRRRRRRRRASCCAAPTSRCTRRRSSARAGTPPTTRRWTSAAREHARIGAELRQALDAGDQFAPALPADRRAAARPGQRRGGAGAVAAPGTRARVARRLHPDRRAHRPDRRRSAGGSCGRRARRRRRWSADARRTADLTVSVNVSARQLREPGFPDEVATMLAETGLDPARLTVEVTETAVFDSDAALDRRCARYTSLGVRIALDDFGTGHSSLGLLRSCPVDILKVDKSFVDEVTGTAEQAAIATSLIQITNTLRLARGRRGRGDRRAGAHRCTGSATATRRASTSPDPMPAERVVDLLAAPEEHRVAA